MSGGVDSSVTAALLIGQGYDVTGVFMKNWARDLPGFKCPWREDLADAKRVAVQLGIPFKIFDFQKEYKQKVVDYMIEEFQAGRTPNPDIMCNQEVKFKLFLEASLEDGADMIATGHYARISDSTNSKHEAPNSKQITNNNNQNSKLALEIVITDSDLPDRQAGRESSKSRDPRIKFEDDGIRLLQAVDDNKDQTYFLYRVTEDALSKTLFPLGGMIKPDVRKKAKELGLITAEKKDSVGICFVGQIGIKDFLKNFVETEPGDIVEKESGKVIGQHEGAIFYTIGQRHGLDVGGGMPYYVIGKDMKKNEVYVTTDLNDGTLWQKTFNLADLHWINSAPKSGAKLQVRTRHRAPLVECTLERAPEDGPLAVKLENEIRALTPGQSAVFYDGEVCLGGGIISTV
jgi:tRNA-specific 2-thiouridylase